MDPKIRIFMLYFSGFGGIIRTVHPPSFRRAYRPSGNRVECSDVDGSESHRFKPGFFGYFLAHVLRTLFALFGDRIPLDGRLALFGICLGVFTYATHGWNIVGQFGFCYFLMWLAVVLPLKNWERFGDFSYGVYIFAWPIMTFGAHFGLPQRGWIVYHLVIIIATHVVAFLSWHLIEKPAMSLKNWTPVWMKILFQKCRRADKNQPPAEVKASPESPKANS